MEDLKIDCIYLTEEDCHEIVKNFTESSLKNVKNLLGDDYICGYREGIETFLQYLIKNNSL